MTNQKNARNCHQAILLADTNAEKIQDILEKKMERLLRESGNSLSSQDLRSLVSEYSSVDLAYCSRNIPLDLRFSLYKYLPSISAKRTFMINTDHTTRKVVLQNVYKADLQKLFASMPANEATGILEDLDDADFLKILRLLTRKKAQVLASMRKSRKDCASRLMTDMFFAFPMKETIGHAAEVIRDHPEIDFTKGIFIIDSLGVLQGHVPLRAMLVPCFSTCLEKIMRPVSHKVSANATRQEVIDLVEKYKIPSLAVVDENRVLVGVITAEDIVEALEDVADETMAKIAGTAETPHSDQGVFSRCVARSPWLFVTLISGFLNVGMMSSSGQHFPESFFFIFFFVPLVTGLSGNIGIQCSTVLVRNFAIGSLCSFTKAEAMRKELASGLFSGLIFGIFCGMSICFFALLFGLRFGPNPLGVALVVSCGLIGACFAGTFLGVFSPIFFMRLGIDPAISSGPIITAFNDFISMAIYFFIAWGLHFLLFL